MATSILGGDDLVWSLNLVSGQVGRIQRHVFEHLAFADNQVEVEPFTPSYDPATWTPKTKDEYRAWVGTVAAQTPAESQFDQNTLFGIVADPA